MLDCQHTGAATVGVHQHEQLNAKPDQNVDLSHDGKLPTPDLMRQFSSGI